MSTQVLSSSSSSSVGVYTNRPRITPAVGCLSRVKRCLFVDSRSEAEREDALQQAKAELDRLTQQDSNRWNFNFVAEKPINNGRFNWSSTTTLPSPPQSPSNIVLRQSQITGKIKFQVVKKKKKLFFFGEGEKKKEKGGKKLFFFPDVWFFFISWGGRKRCRCSPSKKRKTFFFFSPLSLRGWNLSPFSFFFPYPPPPKHMLS